MCDIPAGMKFRGQAIGEAFAAFANAFPDAHRELVRFLDWPLCRRTGVCCPPTVEK
jgi:hypothetical protein